MRRSAGALGRRAFDYLKAPRRWKIVLLDDMQEVVDGDDPRLAM